MLRYLGALVLAAAGAVAPAASTSALAQEVANGPTAGRIEIRLADAPTSERANSRARLYIIDNLVPGTVIHRLVQVTNFSRSPVHVAVYPAAATIGRGSFTGVPGRTPDKLSQWITMSRDVLSLAPGAQAMDGVTISVPRNASRGERYAEIWAQVAAAAPVAGGITVVNRAGIRIYLSVGPGGGPPTNFAINSLTARRSASGRPSIIALVHNTGGRAVDLSGELSLADGPAHQRAGPFMVQLGTTLAPGQSEPVTVILDKLLPDGPWLAVIDLRSGLTEHRAQAIIRFPGRAGAARPVHAAPVVATASFLTMTSVLVVALVLIGAALILVRRRRPPARASSASRQG